MKITLTTDLILSSFLTVLPVDNGPLSAGQSVRYPTKVSESVLIVLFNAEKSYIASDAHLEHAEASDVVSELAENIRVLCFHSCS